MVRMAVVEAQWVRVDGSKVRCCEVFVCANYERFFSKEQHSETVADPLVAILQGVWVGSDTQTATRATKGKCATRI
jgi:hypothetical protein